jgi:hypothetical protein
MAHNEDCNLWLVWWIKEFSNIEIEWQEKTLKNIMDSEFSINQFFNTNWLTKKNISEVIFDNIWININNREWINSIQEIYEKAIDIYINELLIELKKPFIWLKFKNKDSIISFINKTLDDNFPERRQIYCDLIKIMFHLWKIKLNPQLNNIEKNCDKVISKNIFNDKDFIFDGEDLMNIKNNGDFEKKWYYEINWIYNHKSWSKKFKLKFRPKTEKKIVLKYLYSQKNVNDLDIIKDSIWFEFECESIEESIYFLEKIYFIYKEKWLYPGKNTADFRQKYWFYNKDIIDKLPFLTEEFKEYFNNNLKSSKKITWNDKYKDCKFVWFIRIWNSSTWVEWRVTIKWNKNQSWLASNEITNWKKRILSILWLRWWVSDNYIKRVVSHIKEGWTKKNAEQIHNYYFRLLTQINIPRINKKLYSTIPTMNYIQNNSTNTPNFILDATKREVKNIIDW